MTGAAVQGCPFCRIVAGTDPCEAVYEDDAVLAFEDWNPQMPVHVLVIPKGHYAGLGDGVPEDLLGHLLATVDKVARLKGIGESGYRVVANTGSDARQTVFHLHLHVMGGGRMVGGSPKDVPGAIHREWAPDGS